MAQKIKPTPILTGKDAVKFLEDIRQPPSKEKIEFVAKIRKEMKGDLF